MRTGRRRGAGENVAEVKGLEPNWSLKGKGRDSNFKKRNSQNLPVRAALHQQNLCCVLVFLESQIYVC